jgi:peptidyl-prolyl cis-trans isomerase B (cyclophilin B)
MVSSKFEEEVKKTKTILGKTVAELTAEDMEKLAAVIETNAGTIKLKFFPRQAPNHCKNFILLAEKGFYNDLVFHRVIKGFMIQGGDPKGTGTGGPGWNVDAEFSKLPHTKGTLSMARAQDPNSAGSQFFICLDKQSVLDGQYTVFGQVTSGQEVVDKIGVTKTGAQDRPVEPQVMKKVSIEKIG